MTDSAHRLLTLRGVRQNNLVGFDVEIPLRELLAVTGPSGSGRRSFVFSTVHAESRRRYLETFSSATRSRIDASPRPQVDRADGLPLTVAIRTDSLAAGPRNTVATATGILPLLANLFSRFAKPFCPVCRHDVSRWTPAEIAADLQQLPAGTKLMLGFTFRESIDVAEAAEWLRKAGFTRAITNHRLIPLEELSSATGRIADSGLPVVVDRLKSDTEAGRIRESVELCFRGGRQDCFVLIDAEHSAEANRVDVDGRSWMERFYHSSFVCGTCAAAFPDPTPERFQFTTPLGACATCRGIGSVRVSRSSARETCPECRGTRFAAETAAFRLSDLSLPQWLSLSIGEFPEQLTVANLHPSALALTDSIGRRLSAADRLHLGALTLSESISELSPSERRRLALSQALVTPLTRALYLVDSVTTGIPADEVASVVAPLRDLAAAGAGVWVIDDHPVVIESVDRVLEFGPGSGTDGGQIVAFETSTKIPSSAVPTEPLQPRSTSASSRLLLRDAAQGTTYAFPLGGVTVLTGKSATRPLTFFRRRIVPALRGERSAHPEALEVVEGAEPEEFVVIDAELRRPHPRAHVLSAIQIFSTVRMLFADTPEAKRRNLGGNHFSPHTADGLRCPECEGIGRIAVDLHHLPDLEVVCPECLGTRYQSAVADIRFRGLSLVELLDMTVDEAFRFFKGHPRIQRRLQTLRELRLQYLRLGQPLSQLSLGERCRLRMAHEFARVSQSRRFYAIEEPSFGLSRNEVRQLADVFRQVTTSGGTILVLDPHDEFVAAADCVIELRSVSRSAAGR